MATLIVADPPLSPGMVPVPLTEVMVPVAGLTMKPPEVSEPEFT